MSSLHAQPPLPSSRSGVCMWVFSKSGLPVTIKPVAVTQSCHNRPDSSSEDHTWLRVIRSCL